MLTSTLFGGRVHLVAELPGRDVEIIVARPGT